MTTLYTDDRYESLFSREARRVAGQESVLVDLPRENADTISLAFGDADPEWFPQHRFTATMQSVMAGPVDRFMNYAPADALLLELVTQRLERRGIRVEPAKLMLTYGSSQVLGLLPTILLEPGDTIIVEGPTFLGAVEYFAAADARFETIPVGPGGMDLDVLEETLQRLKRTGVRPKFIYSIPTYQNPTGTLMSAENRARLVALAAAYEVLLIEDDAYGELSYSPLDVPSMLTLPGNEWVLHIGTFSKILAPGVRMAWAYGPESVIRRLQRFKTESDCGTFITRYVAAMASDGWLDGHIAGLRTHYAAKRDAMRTAIAAHFPADVRTTDPTGGFFIYGYLPPDLPARSLITTAIAHGASFLPGTTGYANGGGTHEMRLAFSYQSTQRIVEGISRLGAAMRQLRASQGKGS